MKNITTTLAVLILTANATFGHDHVYREDVESGPPMLYGVYALVASVAVSLLSLAGIFFVATAINEDIQFFLSSVAIGSLLGDTFLHLIPVIFSGHSHSHGAEHHDEHNHGSSTNYGLIILMSFFFCFFLEIFLRFKQQQYERRSSSTAHSSSHGHFHHIKAFGWLNLFGDGIHNFMDGVGLAGAFYISTPLGIASTLCICLHELPQELSDFGVLVSAGFTSTQALYFNLLSALFSVLGCLLGLLLNSTSILKNFAFVSDEKALVSITTGSFLYIVASMIPEVMNQMFSRNHKKHERNLPLICGVGIGIGVGVMLLISLTEHSVLDFFTK
ncbi:histidine-rich membrane protein [Acrasis kona]|uniref:Histidine-rich membrane protein n=1 Tax=Acrasis kona TaxID=1008807 RepID=A0AAW2ZF05_9EUKA